MTAYYNEIDPYAAQWLRNLISAGHIAPGDVDERSIVDVRADDLKGYVQCHFFAGIGGWSFALRLAGWLDDRPVWTGSCPCQPFSAAGAGKAANDERHLWPAWFPLIAECKPSIVLGEQVEAAIGWGWLDAVFSDLEGEGYACGATILPACSVGAPHIRQRLWFMADGTGIGRGEKRQNNAGFIARNGAQGIAAGLEPGGDLSGMADPDGRDASTEGLQRSGEQRQRTQDSCSSALGNTSEPTEWRRGLFGPGEGAGSDSRGQTPDQPFGDGVARELGHTDEPRSQGQQQQRNSADQWIVRSASVAGFWSDAEWIACTDGKARPVGPGSFPLGHGIQRRASKLRAYGNAIVPQVAAEFITAASEIT